MLNDSSQEDRIVRNEVHHQLCADPNDNEGLLNFGLTNTAVFLRLANTNGMSTTYDEFKSVQKKQLDTRRFNAEAKALEKTIKGMVTRAGIPDHAEDAFHQAMLVIHELVNRHVKKNGEPKEIGYYYRVAVNVVNRYISGEKKQLQVLDIKLVSNDPLAHMSYEEKCNYVHRYDKRCPRSLSLQLLDEKVRSFVRAGKPFKLYLREPDIGFDEDVFGESLIEKLPSGLINSEENIERKQIRQIICDSIDDCFLKSANNDAEKSEKYKKAFELFWRSQDNEDPVSAEEVARHIGLSPPTVSNKFKIVYGCLKMKLIEHGAISHHKPGFLFSDAAKAIHFFRGYDQDGKGAKFFNAVDFSESIYLARLCAINKISEQYILSRHYQYKTIRKIKAWAGLCIEVADVFKKSSEIKQKTLPESIIVKLQKMVSDQ